MDGDAVVPFDWDAYAWSEEARGRKGSLLQDIMARFASMPGTIPMHGGLPPADAFPFSSLCFSLAPAAAGGGGVGGAGGGGVVGGAGAAPALGDNGEADDEGPSSPPPSSDDDLLPAAAGGVDATIVVTPAAHHGGPAAAAARKVAAGAAATPSPDHSAPRDLNGGKAAAASAAVVAAPAAAAPAAPAAAAAAVAAVAAAAASPCRRLCRCNAAAAAAALSSGPSSAAPATLVIDSPLAVAAAQQYNIGNYGQSGLRAWAARATAELQRPRDIAGSDAWLRRQRRRGGSSRQEQQQQRQRGGSSSPVLPPPPPPPAPTGHPRAAAGPLRAGGRDLVLTAGSTAALDAALRALLSRGDALLAEEFTYSHALEALMAPHGYRLVPVGMDRAQGLCPRALDAAARREHARCGRAPRVLYTIPVGQNPTGSVAGARRLAEVYAVARMWGMVIIEDDAYCWLRLHDDGGGGGGGGGGGASGGEGGAGAPSEASANGGPASAPPCAEPVRPPLLAPLLPRPGLLSLDADGRVLRLDTFAKLLAPGLRLGWASGPARLVRVVAEATMAATVGPAALSQAVASGLLQRWGCCCCVFEEEEEVEEDEAGEDAEDEGEQGGRAAAAARPPRPLPASVSAIGAGFRHYLAALQHRYAVQADLAARCAERHLAGVADWIPPRAGMFLWVRLLPAAAAAVAGEAEGEGGGAAAAPAPAPASPTPPAVVDGDSVVRRAGDLGVAVVPGRIFAVESYLHADGGAEAGGAAPAAPAAAGRPLPLPPCPYLRVSFVNTPPHLVDEGMRRLRVAIDQELAEMRASGGRALICC